MMTGSRPAGGLMPRTGNRSWYDDTPRDASIPAYEARYEPHVGYDEADFDVVYHDNAGRPMIAFGNGQWFDVSTYLPRQISVRAALRRDATWAGAVVQTVCFWMRTNPNSERSFELATELALAVGELARDR